MPLESRTLAEWYDDEIFLLDLREPHEQAYTFTSPLVVNIPWSQQADRSSEYPSRSTRFALFCPPEKALDQVEWFTNAELHPTKQPWLVEYFVVDSADTRDQARQLRLVSDAPQDAFPLPRLWSPNSLMPRLLDVLKSMDLSPSSSSVVYDLGCGSCRDIVYLSEEIRGTHPQLQFCGVDWNAKSVERSLAFAARRGVADTFSFELVNLRKLDVVSALLERPDRAIACVYGCRYISRELLALVRDVLPVGAVFAWCHFAMPEDGVWKWQHPSKRRDILERGELRDLFQAQYDVLVDAYEPDSDHGRPLNVFIARKTSMDMHES